MTPKEQADKWFNKFGLEAKNQAIYEVGGL